MCICAGKNYLCWAICTYLYYKIITCLFQLTANIKTRNVLYLHREPGTSAKFFQLDNPYLPAVAFPECYTNSFMHDSLSIPESCKSLILVLCCTIKKAYTCIIMYKLYMCVLCTWEVRYPPVYPNDTVESGLR